MDKNIKNVMFKLGFLILIVSTILDVIYFSKITDIAKETILFKIGYYTARNIVEIGLFGLGLWVGYQIRSKIIENPIIKKVQNFDFSGAS